METCYKFDILETKDAVQNAFVPDFFEHHIKWQKSRGFISQSV